MKNWKLPNTLKSLRGFLGLTGYYRKFVKGYGIISKPLTDLLKKDGFHWNPDAISAFHKLKEAMSSVPVLTLPDFSKVFYLETDACGTGIKVVLSQNGRPIAYLSKALGPKHMDLSIYEKEYLAILMAVSKWRHYLEGGTFVIKTDHESLKHLLEQKLTTSIQKKGLTKLLGLDYTIQYRSGKTNKVADALSRQFEKEAQLQGLTSITIIPEWIKELEQSYKGDKSVEDMISQLSIAPNSSPQFSYTNGILRCKGRVYVGNQGQLRYQLLQKLHDSPQGGHSGVQATYYRIKLYFYWPRMMKDVQKYISQCDNCQRNKNEHVPYPGLLQPIPIPSQTWEVITMDFVEGLPKSQKFTCILVIIDKFTKYAHFFTSFTSFYSLGGS